MTHTGTQQSNIWSQQALFSLGFRPFFLFGCLWTAIAMVIWILSLTGIIEIPTHFDPAAWHAHEFLFGYISAVIAGFLLTAVPNWTGRPPLKGGPLAALFILWLAGRGAVFFSAYLPNVIVAGIDISFALVLGSIILREIIAARNWRNLIILGLLALFTLANLLFYLETVHDHIAAQNYAIRLGVGAIMMMIFVIGGRVIPAFTGNWLRARSAKTRAVAPMERFDKLTLLTSIPVLVVWIILPEEGVSGVALAILGLLHFIRLMRWQGHRTLSEPLLWVLHLAYLFIPFGAVLMAVAILAPNFISHASTLHLWMAGAIGLMTLGIMSRASLGHTGRELKAGLPTLLIYLAIVASVIFRLLVELHAQMFFYHLSALCWIAAFGGFAITYGPSLFVPRRDEQRQNSTITVINR